MPVDLAIDRYGTVGEPERRHRLGRGAGRSPAVLATARGGAE
jgi:hypothetical protein